MILALGAMLLGAALPVQTSPADGRPVPPPATIDGDTLRVALGVYILQVSEVDQIGQRFTVDGYLTANWSDPRLAFDGNAFGAPNREYRNQRAQERLDTDIWWPSIELVTADGATEFERYWLTVDTSGTVGVSTRFSATITSEMDLRRFPFDEQVLQIPIESYFHDAGDVVFEVDRAGTGYDGSHDLPEWRITGHDARVDIHDYGRYGEYGDFYGRYSRLNFELKVAREYPFYVWKVFLPLGLIILASWASLWIREDVIMEVAFGLLLTLVAFQFAISDSMPKVPYMTFLDVVLTLSYLSVGLSIPLLIAVRRQEEEAHGSWEMRLLAVCRFGFPLTFLSALVVAILVML